MKTSRLQFTEEPVRPRWSSRWSFLSRLKWTLVIKRKYCDIARHEKLHKKAVSFYLYEMSYFLNVTNVFCICFTDCKWPLANVLNRKWHHTVSTKKCQEKRKSVFLDFLKDNYILVHVGGQFMIKVKFLFFDRVPYNRNIW